MEKNKCPLCDKENIDFLRLDGNKNATLIANRFPGNNFHLLVIPNEHYTTADGMPLEIWLDLCSLLKKTLHRICDFVKYEELLIFANQSKAAGQELEHFHWHIVLKMDERDSFSSVRPKENIEQRFGNQKNFEKFFIAYSHIGINFINQIVMKNPAIRKMDHMSEETWLEVAEQIQKSITNIKGIIKTDGINISCTQKKSPENPFTVSIAVRYYDDDLENPKRGDRCRSQEITLEEIKRFRKIFS